MIENYGLDLVRHLMKVQCLAENLPAPGKVPAHNRVVSVNSAERSAVIFNVGAEKVGDELILQFFDAPPVGMAKKKSDHAILEDSIDKRVDDRAKPARAAELIEKSLSHGLNG